MGEARGSQVQASPTLAEGAAFGVGAGVPFGRLAPTSHLGLKGLERRGHLRGGPARAQPLALRLALLGREQEWGEEGLLASGAPPTGGAPCGDLPALQVEL